MKRGYFITFEGVDGSGKSTQIQILMNYLREMNFEVVLAREPGGTAISEKIREIILDTGNSNMSYMTEAMLYAAARAQLVKELIEPAVKSGKIVICDRFIDSSMAYQAYGRQLGKAVWDINRYAIGDFMPDLTILLKLNPDTGMSRISNRAQDRIEMASLDFHRRVFEGYLELERSFPDRIKGIDAGMRIDEISGQIRDLIMNLIGGQGVPSEEQESLQ